MTRRSCQDGYGSSQVDPTTPTLNRTNLREKRSGQYGQDLLVSGANVLCHVVCLSDAFPGIWFQGICFRISVIGQIPVKASSKSPKVGKSAR